MRIVHLSKNDRQGGAARAAFRLHEGLRREGQESFMLVADRSSDDPHVIAAGRPMDVVSRLRRGIREQRVAADFARYRRSRPAGYEQFTDDRTEHSQTVVD